MRATDVVLDADLRPRFTLSSPWGSGAVSLAVRGAHQVVNASLAATVALAHGVPFDDVAAGLAAVLPAPWRMEVARTAEGVVVLDDAYNANPSSMAAALEALARVEVSGRRIAVLGEMRELGEHSAPSTPRSATSSPPPRSTRWSPSVPRRRRSPSTRVPPGSSVTEVPDAATALERSPASCTAATRCW